MSNPECDCSQCRGDFDANEDDCEDELHNEAEVDPPFLAVDDYWDDNEDRFYEDEEDHDFMRPY